MHADYYVQRAFEVIHIYNGSEPLHNFLKRFFRANSNMGRRDRSAVTQLVYSWFRTGTSLTEEKDSVRMVIGAYLAGEAREEIIRHLFERENLEYKAYEHLEERIKYVQDLLPHFDLEKLFPFSQKTSTGLDIDSFLKSFLQKPLIWLRVKAGNRENIATVLNDNKITYQSEDGIIGISGNMNLEQLPGMNAKWFEIQDRSSQLTGDLMQPQNAQKWLDSCAGSGGKSLLLLSRNKKIDLTVNDSRKSILNNLKERFRKNEISNYMITNYDLENSSGCYPENYFDGIIADVPCTGSGTWARTPENICFFEERYIEIYSSRQKKMLGNIIPSLKPGGSLIYITCSVFKDENEEVVNYLASEFNMILQEVKVIRGSEYGADTMFAAHLIRV